MESTSTRYKELIYSNGAKFHIFVGITPIENNMVDSDDHITNGSEQTDEISNSLNLDESEIMEDGLKIEESVSAPGKFEVGGVAISELTLELYNENDKYTNFPFDNATVQVKVGLVVNETTIDPNIAETDARIEWISMGYFAISETIFENNTVKIKAYSDMHALDRPYSDSKLTYPATLETIYQDACKICGVPFQTASFLNSSYVVKTRPTDEKTTFREIMSWIAQLAGCFARINRNGLLELAWYDMSQLDKENGDFVNVTETESCEVAHSDVTITGVKIIPENKEEKTYFSGNAGFVVTIENNPLVQGDMDDVCENLKNKLVGFKFRPYKANIFGNPAIVAGDVCKVKDQKGNVHKSFISSISYNFGDFENIQADCESVQKKTLTRFSLASKIDQTVTSKVQKQTTFLEMYSKQLSDLMANSMGLYQTTETESDGKTIVYMHDQPTKSGSRIIWAKTRDAFTFSNDGGETWQGITADGNVVANILSVIGLNANWINTGTLRVGQEQEPPGIIEIYGNTNRKIGQIDQDGITLWSKDAVEGDTQRICLNEDAGLVGYCGNDQKIFWADKHEFHMNESYVQNNAIFANRLSFIPINRDENYGIAIVGCENYDA